MADVEIKRYCGNAKPFVYAVVHGSDKVMAREVLQNLCARKYSVWYEELAHAGFDRRSKKRMEKAALVMLFMSPAASADDEINKAISYAVLKSIPILTVYLEPTELTPAQKLQLNTYQGLMKYSFESGHDFYEKLYGSSVMNLTSVTPAQKKSARRQSAVSWAAAITTVFAVVCIVFLSSVGGAVKKGSLMDDFGYAGALSDINSIYIYATKTMDADQGASRPLTKDGADYLQIVRTGEALARGDIMDIGDFAQLKNLKTLVFTGNALKDISPLYKLNHLEYLDISCNPVADLKGIGKATSLTTLCIAYTKVLDVSPLLDCRSLKSVNISCDMEAEFAGLNADFDIVITDHLWNDWHETVKATHKQEGRWQRSCVICGKMEADVVPMTGMDDLGIENLTPHIFGGAEEKGKIGNDIPYGIYILGVSTEYTYVFKKNGTIINCSGREYLDGDDDDDELPNKTHIWPDPLQMGDYDPDATYTLEVTDKGRSYTYTIRHKYD